MIFDALHRSARYAGLHSHFQLAFDYLKTLNGSEVPGRYDLDGDRCFALVQTYQTKPQSAALFEAHRKYIDVQFLFSGRETILWAPLEGMKEQTMAYDEAKDAALWKLVSDSTPLHVSAGQFVILYPEDAHAPCIEWENAENVFKVVIKVAVE